MTNESVERPTAVEYGLAPVQRWDAIFSIVIGIFLILWMPRIWGFAIGHDGGWTFSDATGNPLPYTKTIYFPGDLAMALFSVALIVEGLVLLVRRSRPLLAICFALTVIATLSNLAYLLYMMQAGYHFQLPSGLATAVGLYIARYQWWLLGRRNLV